MAKRIKIAPRYSLLSPAMMWTGMLLACLAWIMLITPLLTPLWSDNASLGHGVCIELAPVVAAAKNHATDHSIHDHALHSQAHSAPMRASADATASLAYSSQVSHSQLSSTTDKLTTIISVAMQVVPDSMIGEHHSHLMAADEKPQTLEEAASKDQAKQHSGCDICTSMAGFTLPMDLKQPDTILVELFTASVMVFYRSYILKNLSFLHPLTRAPPSYGFV